MKEQNAIERFRHFAEARLRNHAEELDTRYRNRKVDGSLLREAFDQHGRIYEQELSEKIEELLIKGDQTLEPHLTKLKQEYLKTLKERQAR